MNKSLARLALLIATATPLAAVAQKAPDTTPAPKKADVPPRERLLPEINFNGNALGDVIDFLRDITGCQFVLVRPQGMNPADDPTVTLRLKNASLDQVLEILTRECPIEVSTVAPIRQGDGEVTVVKVIAAPSRPDRAAPGSAVRVYHLASITAALRPPTAEAAVPRGFNLRQENGEDVAALQKRMEAKEAELAKARVDAREVDAKAQKEALTDVLSLCKAAIDQVPDGAKTSLQVHEPTQTLIFKGTPEQEAALEDVLNALDPNRGQADKAVVRRRERAVAAEVQAQIDAQVQDLQRQRKEMEAQATRADERAAERLSEAQQRNDEMKTRLSKQQDDILQLEREIERTKVRLEAAEKAAATSAPADKGKDSPKKD